jgi:DnaJ-class molecular chaperone
MANGKDYYQILGVPRNASQEDIKQAYKRLAKEHHPDMVDASNKESAEKRFKEINEAYQVLGDGQKRKMYDQFGTADPSMGFGGQGAGRYGQWGPFSYTYTSGGPAESSFDFGSSDFDPLDIFEDFFGFRGFGGAKRPKRGKNLHYEMVIDFKDALFGFEKEINTESGRVLIKVPAGVRDGSELRFAGKGMPGGSGMPPGDLFLTLRVKYPSEFKVINGNLVVTIEISFVKATLGGEIEIPVVDLLKPNGIGRVKLKIPAGTQHGAGFVVKGRGMPVVHRKGQADVLVQILVKIPARISREQKDLLERLQKTM